MKIFISMLLLPIICFTQVKVHGGEHIDPPSSFYSVKLNGQEAYVNHYKVYEPAYDMEYNFVSYVHFDMDQPVEVEVTFKDMIDPNSTWLSPLRKNIPYKIEDKVLTFTIDKPQKLILGINTPNDNDQDVEKEGILAIIAMPKEENVPNVSDANVLNVLDYSSPQRAFDQCPSGGTVYFPKGIYRGQFTVKKSNTTVYLESGAIIRSNETPLIIKDKDHVTLKGRGSLQTNFPSTNFVLEPRNCDNLTIEGIIIRMGGARVHKNGVKIRGGGFAVVPHYCNYLKINNIAVLRYHHGADGIDPDNCQHVEISDNILLTGDDAICPKTMEKPYVPMDDFKITNNVVRNGQASGFKIGTQASSDISNIVVDGLDMIHTGQFKFSDRNRESDIKSLLIKNATIEYAEHSLLQISAVDFMGTTKAFRGNINMSIENLTVYKTGREDNKEKFAGLFLFAEPEYDCKVTFVNLVVEGKKITSLKDLEQIGCLPKDKSKIENVKVVFKN
ncbi:Glycosyl hydrolases family 28 [Flaviramulus basaltis]|uniref:Glycosyl hydrolases family 28 n=1 Tax=Flaviramulus basaltis TaxID=369401 RepID=A0A1K2IAN0_9FLAO|nr:glycosyl hydrolase family 28 protein [Flaviramulus basaltis]SFZ89461.1 Glycosyl hydrolases family 28 [Flaviramulus basaltis]